MARYDLEGAQREQRRKSPDDPARWCGRSGVGMAIGHGDIEATTKNICPQENNFLLPL
jgi:hypothetical protein